MYRKKIGWRTEQLYGEGYLDAASVIAHEVFNLNNTDILETLSEGVLKNSRYCNKLKKLIMVIEGDLKDLEMEHFLDIAFDNEEIGINYFKDVLQEIKEITGKDIKYVLWLCDTIEDIILEYANDDTQLDDFDGYEISDIIISDIGTAGKLYGYEEKPIVCC